MAKIRAYKLAEELGIERGEIVEKVQALGIELKSTMSSLDEADAALVREKLGKSLKKGPVVERRVERKGGSAVIRRRKKAEPEPVPEPVAAEPLAEAPSLEIAEPEPLPVVEGPEEAPGPELEQEPAVAELAQPAAPKPASEDGAPEAKPAAPAGPADARAKQARKRVREVVNLKEQEQIARQVTGRTSQRRTVSVDPRAFASPRRRRRDAPAKPAAVVQAPPKPTKRVVRVEGTITVNELARELGSKAAEVQGKLMALGTLASLNQSIDLETARQVASQFDFEVQDVGFREEELLQAPDAPGDSAAVVARPPVITVMGHVDHGKTSLLDAIRKTNVVAGEAGGITQHIGAYQVVLGGHKLTFVDTPGHAAFTAMRARGAKITDIVVLVVAANDGIMPQTIEAIDHARAAEVPIIVAVNKCDLPDAKSEQIRQRLMEHGLVPETFGGDVICVDVSATQGTGIDQLLEMLNLQSDVLELKADPTKRATGVVLEAQLDRGRGPVATVLVQDGTLKVGDTVVVGTVTGRIRAMQDENGQRLKTAPPSTPVQITGLSGVPEASQLFHVVEDDRAARQIIGHRESTARGRFVEARPRLTLEEIFSAQDGGVQELAVVLKADVQGSVEAVRDALLKLSTDAVKVDVIHSGVGAISESDVMLARASNAIVLGFHVRPDPAARRAADTQGVEIRNYTIIYEISDDVKLAMAGLLPPTVTENALGRAEVRQTFTVPKIGAIGGCYVLEGLIRRNALCRLVRDGVQVYQGKLGSLRRFKDDAREVAAGFECGIGIEGYNDIKVGDIIEVYVLEEHAATL